MKIKAIIFDVDGVLIDSVPYHFRSWKKLFNQQGISFTFDDYLTKVNGIPRINGIKKIIPHISKNDAEKLSVMKQKYFLEYVTSKPPTPIRYVKKLLRSLKNKQFILAAASSSKNAPYLLKQSNLTPFFNVIVSGNDFTKSKPDPEIFLTAARKIKVNPSFCGVVEDAVVGVEAARNAGMFSIGILSSQDSLITQKADISIHSMKEYNKILETITSY